MDTQIFFYGIDFGAYYIVISEGNIINLKDKIITYRVKDNQFGQKKN